MWSYILCITSVFDFAIYHFGTVQFRTSILDLCGDLTAAYLRSKRQLRSKLVCVSGGLFLSPSLYYFPAVHGSSAMRITELLLFSLQNSWRVSVEERKRDMSMSEKHICLMLFLVLIFSFFPNVVPMCWDQRADTASFWSLNRWLVVSLF